MGLACVQWKFLLNTLNCEHVSTLEHVRYVSSRNFNSTMHNPRQLCTIAHRLRKKIVFYLRVHTSKEYLNNFFSFFSFITVVALSLSSLRFLSSLPRILLSLPFLQILINQTYCKILNQMCNFQFQHKPINPLLLRASSSSTVSFFLFCYGFFC